LVAGESDWLTVAVLDFDASDARLKESGTQLALLLTTKLSTLDAVVVVERQDLSKLLGEQELGASGLVNPGTAARIGQLTGARVLVTGRVFAVAGETTVAVKVMSTETGRVFGASIDFSTSSSLTVPAEQLAGKLAELLQAKKSALVATPPSMVDRVARLKQKFAGRTLPSVTINIPEQHFGSPVVDPAAETEIGLILNEAGFQILTGESAAKADYRISGEAFSETGIHRGGLVSCRARVEVKAVSHDGGRAVLVDRQVTVAVDTAEHVAAKNALQQAGGALAERIADALVQIR
jgi:hypothetical protein